MNGLSVYLDDPKPEFISDDIEKRVRYVRNAIHHLEEKVVKGEIVEGQPAAIKPDGLEAPHPIESGQTIKTLDRLVIGPHHLLFADMAVWLNEMSDAATRIAQYHTCRGTIAS